MKPEEAPDVGVELDLRGDRAAGRRSVPDEPKTHLVLEAQGGLVRVRAECRDGKAKRIFVQNLPSCAADLDRTIEVEEPGALVVDTAYGGDSFVVIDAESFGFSLAENEAHGIAGLGVRITNAANA